MQLFVRGLDSQTQVCEVEACGVVADVKRCIQASQGIPCCSQGLVFAGRQLQDERSLASYGINAHSTVHLVLRLCGGKGGFGALLRGLGRDGSKTTNDDAMRDLQGRRMRHANAEKKLQEWEAKAKERELERIALKHIKEQERAARKEREEKVEVESIVQEHKATVAKVQDAVQSALAAAKQPGTAPAGAGPAKRTAAGSSAAPPAKQPPAKRARGMMAALETLGSESEESSEEEEEGGDA